MDETLLVTTRYLQGTNQPKAQTQRVKISLKLVLRYVKLIDTRVTRKPGDGGWIRSSVASRKSQIAPKNAQLCIKPYMLCSESRRYYAMTNARMYTASSYMYILAYKNRQTVNINYQVVDAAAPVGAKNSSAEGYTVATPPVVKY